MKTIIKILIVYSCVFSHNLFATDTDIDNSNSLLSGLQKQRTEQYLQYISLQGDSTDSLKVIAANQLLETDNLIITKINALDSLQKNQNIKISILKIKEAANKNIFFITCAAGGFVFLLFVCFLILFFIFRSKNKKLFSEKELLKNNSELINSELIAIKIEKSEKELVLNETIKKIQSELNLKNEIISNLESKFKEFNQSESNIKEQLNDSKNELSELQQKFTNSTSQYNDINTKNLTLINSNNELLNQKSELIIELEKHKKSIENLQEQKTLAEQNLDSYKTQKSLEKTIDNSIAAENLKLTDENKNLMVKIETLQSEKIDIVMKYKQDLEEKEQLYKKIYLLEDEFYDLKLKHPEHQIAAIREMVEQNIETLKIAITKLSVEKDQYEKILRMREPEEVLMQKINKLVEENFNLQLDLEDEKIYSEKLNEKLDKYLDELEKQDLQLELLSIKATDRTTPENRTKYDEMDLNLIKLEKLNRLKEMMAITEEEYQQIKINIITQI